MSICPIGTHKAKLVDYGIGTTNAGAPQLVAKFEVFVGDSTFPLTWFGSFKDTVRDHTIKALLSVFNLWCEPNEIEAKLGEISERGKESGLLDTDKEYALVVEHKPDDKGKIRASIRWVNNPGMGAQFERLAANEAKGLFAGMNLAGNVAEFKQKNPGLAGKKKDGIPF